MNAKLTPLRSFILPGGSPLAAHLHLCRTVSRRAERHVVELASIETINDDAREIPQPPLRLVFRRGPHRQ